MDSNTIAVIILLATFFILILLRVNIAFAVGIASCLCLLYLGIPLSNVCQQMVKGLNSFSLMAVPFFITMGGLMGSGGISERLIMLADSMVGWMRGGAAMVNILASLFFGGISGSSALPQHGNLCNCRRRTFCRRPVYGRIYSGRNVGSFPDDRFLYYLS